jgi:hypothetical protein
MPFPKAFRVSEANALIPELEEVFELLDRPAERLEELMDRIKVLDVLWGARLEEPSNPDREEFLADRAALRRTLREIESLVEARMQPLGVRFPPGGLEHGLVDFPTTLDGRWVFLCWKRGEPRVAHWHEVEGGFAGRLALSGAVAKRMGEGGEPGNDPGRAG